MFNLIEAFKPYIGRTEDLERIKLIISQVRLENIENTTPELDVEWMLHWLLRQGLLVSNEDQTLTFHAKPELQEARATTVMIYDQCDSDLRFIVLAGDYRHLNKIYINTYPKGRSKAAKKQHEDLMDQLADLLFVPLTGEKRHKHLKDFPIEAVKSGAYIIVAGMLP